MNTFDVNDPNLTAYVLGELDAVETAALEREMMKDQSLRAAVEDIRRTAEMLGDELAAEPAPGLTESHREAITAGPKDVLNSPWIFRSRTAWGAIGLAAAACLVIAIFLPTLTRSGDSERFALHDARDKESLPRQQAFGPETGELNETDAVASKDSQRETAAEQFAAADHMLREAQAQVDLKGQENRSRGRAITTTPLPPTPTYLPESAAGDSISAQEAPLSITKSRPSREARREGGGGSAGGLRTPSAPAIVTDRQRAFVEGEMSGTDEVVRARADDAGFNREQYNLIVDNPFIKATEQPLSTFSVDVDTASYSNIRRFLNDGQLPPKDAVRIEEMVNYFTYNYEPTSGGTPFSANVEVNAAPWAPHHRLVRIGLKGREVKAEMRPATSLVFLLDVSGSMDEPNKLPLVRESMKLLVEKLNGDDRLAIVTYAGNSGLLIDSTFCTDERKPEITTAIENLRAGGSTHGSAGIQLAYDTATKHFIKGGVNRVILCTDGDFNVGISSDGELVRLIEAKRKSGVFLSVLGFGAGNLQDAKMELLSNAGNGNFAYIDTLNEAKKVLLEQMGGTLVTIAKDVKIQVDFNPAKVGAYRLIGYENRMLAARDFADDAKDAGEIGAGHTVTALYEIIPASDGEEIDVADAPQSDFITPGQVVESDLMLKLKLRYKEPDGDVSKELVFPIRDSGASLEDATVDFRFAAAVASFGMVLRNSEYKGDSTFGSVLDLAATGLENDPHGYRAEFVRLVERARDIPAE